MTRPPDLRTPWARVAIAGIELESVSSLSQTSTLQDFNRVALRGQDIVDKLRGSNTAMGGFIEVLHAQGLDILPLLYTSLGAAGPASDEAIDELTRELADSIDHNSAYIDGVLLFLHGACWSPGQTDVEGSIIAKVRQGLGPDKPLILAFDYHGNLDAATLRDANGAFAYRCSPHTDAGETGQRAARCMVATLRGTLRPCVHIVKPGVLVPSIFSATQLQPLADIIADAAQRQQRHPDYLDISVMAGFSYADSHNTGFSVLATAQSGDSTAVNTVREVAHNIWQNRHSLYRPVPVYSVDQALDRIQQHPPSANRPWVVLEHADRLNDSTYVLAALLRRGIGQAAVALLWDPQAVQASVRAGVGARVDLLLGAHSSVRAGPRLKVKAVVQRIEPLRYRNSGNYMHGLPVDLGLCALLDINGVSVSVTTHSHTAVNGDPFFAFGLRPQDFQIIVLRSKTHFRDFYAPLAREILIVDTADFGPADLTHVHYQRLNTDAVYPFADSVAILGSTQVVHSGAR